MQCWIDFPKLWQWKVYMTLVALTVFLFPTVIIAACYAVIVYTIWSKGKVMTVTSKTLGARSELKGKTEGKFLGYEWERREGWRERREKRNGKVESGCREEKWRSR